MPPEDLSLAYQVLAEEGNTFRWDKSCPDGTLLAYLSSWDDCSEVVLRLPRAQDSKTGTPDPPDGATRRETGQKHGSGESSTPLVDPVVPGSHGIRRRDPAWDPVADPLGYLRFDSQNDRSK